MVDWTVKDKVIAQALQRSDLTPDEILTLVIADRINRCSDNSLAALLTYARR